MGWRMFTAAVPPAGIVAELDRFLEPRRDADDRLRWTLPTSWHLTCSFMADVAEPDVDTLGDRLADALSGCPAFEVELAAAGAFPDPDRAKVLWLGVSRGADQLAAISAKCRGAANRAGVGVDGARYRPHLTLARANGVPAVRWLRVLEALDPLRWQVDSIELIRSSGLPGGAGYQTITRFPLRG